MQLPTLGTLPGSDWISQVCEYELHHGTGMVVIKGGPCTSGILSHFCKAAVGQSDFLTRMHSMIHSILSHAYE